VTNRLPAITPTKRSAFRSALRGVVVIAAGILAYSTAVSAFASSVRWNNPGLVRQFAPLNAQALIASADELVLAGKKDPDFLEIADLSRRSLSIDPINPAALRNLGLTAEKLNNGNRAEALIRLSAATSRRDLMAQLWLIEASTSKDDLKAALLHHDTALRAFSESEATLFPILTAAIEDDAVRRELADRLRRRPYWLDSFMNYAIALSPVPNTVSNLLIQARLHASSDTQRELQRRLLYGLAAKEDWSSAKRYITWLNKADDRLFSHSNLDQTTTNKWFWPFTWEPISVPGISISFEDENSVARISADSGQRIVALRRFTYLKSGGYQISITEQSVLDNRGAEHVWDVNCLRTGIPASTVWTSGPIRGTRLGTINGAFDVPKECNAIGIQLSVVGGLGQQGMELLLRSVSISPIVSILKNS
jgi:tetratricopeptide (TPR) repeat protein